MTKSCRRKTDHVLLGMTICVRADGKEREKEGLDVTHGCPEGKKKSHETEDDHCNWTDLLDYSSK